MGHKPAATFPKTNQRWRRREEVADRGLSDRRLCGALLSVSDLTVTAFHSRGQTLRCRKVAAVIMIPFVWLCLSKFPSGGDSDTNS